MKYSRFYTLFQFENFANLSLTMAHLVFPFANVYNGDNFSFLVAYIMYLHEIQTTQYRNSLAWLWTL